MAKDSGASFEVQFDAEARRVDVQDQRILDLSKGISESIGLVQGPQKVLRVPSRPPKHQIRQRTQAKS